MSAQKTEARAVSAARDFSGKTKTNSADCARLNAERKVLQGLQALFAFRGYALDPQPDGTLIASRWALSRELADLEQAKQFLDAIGGGQ